jgi:hypothetical protein
MDMEFWKQREPFLGLSNVTTRGSGAVGNMPMGFAFAHRLNCAPVKVKAKSNVRETAA